MKRPACCYYYRNCLEVRDGLSDPLQSVRKVHSLLVDFVAHLVLVLDDGWIIDDLFDLPELIGSLVPSDWLVGFGQGDPLLS